MRIQLWEIILSLSFMWSISVCSGIIAWKFYNSVDGRLRVLQYELFMALSFAFGLYGIYYGLWDFYIFGDTPAILVRLVCNGPLCYCIVRYLSYMYSRELGE